MKTILLALSILLTGITQAQTTADLQAFDAKQTKISRAGMYTLGGWAVANIGTGLVLRSQTTGSERYFHEMNAIWNVANLGIATAGILGSRRELPVGLINSLERQRKVELTFLVNGALDFTYITGGFLLTEIGKNNLEYGDRFDGYGKSLVLQGGFLLLFDSVLFISHKRHGKLLNPYLQNVTIGMNGNGLGMTYHL